MMCRRAEIYLFDAANPPEHTLKFQIADNRLIIIVYAGICGTHKIDIQIGGNANARVIIIPLIWHTQSLDLVVTGNHTASKCKSDLKIVGVVADSSQLRCTIISSCDQNVCNVTIEQKADILLLGPHARASTMPAIQGINMNVHCKHGASIKTFDKDQLLYLQSRGIDGVAACSTLCESFLLSWLDNEISDANRESVTSYIRNIVGSHLFSR